LFSHGAVYLRLHFVLSLLKLFYCVCLLNLRLLLHVSCHFRESFA
jgi:hypothetical protein